MTALGASTRVQSLDIVRGVAVLGILLLNIVSFSMPEAAYMNPRAYGGAHGADLAVYLINFVLFDGKMRGLFSFLFGASMLLVIERAEANGRNPVKVHFARMGWLLGFGLAHLWLVWRGDILAHYALVGMLAFTLRGMRPTQMLPLAVMLVLANTLVFTALPMMVLDVQQPAANAAETADNARQLHDLVSGFGIPAPADIARELALYRGGYGGIVRERFAEMAYSPLVILGLYGCETLAYMLFGMVAFRTGMLTGAWERRRYLRWLLVCWGIALPAYIALAAYVVHADFGLFAVTLAVMALATPIRPLMIAGWICLILLLVRSGGALTARLAAAGRMAFTNYLATSLICSTLFNGYGLGWFGYLSRWQLYLVVVAVWVLILLWSKPWLARFRYGPFEWLWRSLARGRLQPLRGGAENT
ncbi:DUF418 domain-containing protein [Sphingomonas sp. JC676]|uniref:DUF418 domain-containing protein n=1 Tax=Sphingomonas sp. JC676 TaxID=2768065 RepID=UPI0016581F1A|nr:DUF418 domain-containing protein [Sphingomonas sp. JC676]MBC9033634.1 DUF418 domain-containing protein [Sphingomonas sp. JC676]